MHEESTEAAVYNNTSPDGIWADDGGNLHLLVQTYPNNERVVLATTNAREFAVFRGPCETDRILFKNDIGEQGHTLHLQITDSMHGILSAKLPFGDFHAKVALLVPALSSTV
jgi:hypothetical protein